MVTLVQNTLNKYEIYHIYKIESCCKYATFLKQFNQGLMQIVRPMAKLYKTGCDTYNSCRRFY